jgi:hypothetical protein
MRQPGADVVARNCIMDQGEIVCTSTWIAPGATSDLTFRGPIQHGCTVWDCSTLDHRQGSDPLSLANQPPDPQHHS